MSVPNHGPECYTRMFQTICRDCDRPVWYFSCNHGSKVFFDSRNHPWPAHKDSCPGYQIRINLENGMSSRQLRQFVEEEASVSGREIPVRVARLLDELDPPSRQRPTIITVAPTAVINTVIGHIVSINEKINVYKLFKLEQSPMSAGLIGKLSTMQLSELRIREYADENNRSREFIVYVSHESISLHGLRQNIHVNVTLSIHNVPGRPSIWCADIILRQ